MLHDVGAGVHSVNDAEALEALKTLSETRGNHTGVRESHAVAHAIKLAHSFARACDDRELVGTRRQDMQTVAKAFGVSL